MIKPMNMSLMIIACLLLTHCASAPKPPHCHDDGKGLKPVNHAAVILKPIGQHDE
ncbi:hypothetical protein JQC92_13305 [Shewanella sp. 202IG2-18]|uniref:hypothetical protein n=1 Tax=Parashewanella hymeniacidonis TaxID=2807618 RepID=UPI001961F926|nr:hypothetical protein [Parashewanella hymeniacidonis]MBM7072993.1 hypothetical protein [Parashewanella hymeniacidonis]